MEYRKFKQANQRDEKKEEEYNESGDFDNVKIV